MSVSSSQRHFLPILVIFQKRAPLFRLESYLGALHASRPCTDLVMAEAKCVVRPDPGPCGRDCRHPKRMYDTGITDGYFRF
jgi:hypothetical protein